MNPTKKSDEILFTISIFIIMFMGIFLMDVNNIPEKFFQEYEIVNIQDKPGQFFLEVEKKINWIGYI